MIEDRWSEHPSFAGSLIFSRVVSGPLRGFYSPMAVARLQLLDEVEELLNMDVMQERWASDYFLETHALEAQERKQFHDIAHNLGAAWGKKIGRILTALIAPGAFKCIGCSSIKSGSAAELLEATLGRALTSRHQSIIQFGQKCQAIGEMIHYLCGLSYEAYGYNPTEAVERMRVNGDHVRGVILEDLSNLIL